MNALSVISSFRLDASKPGLCRIASMSAARSDLRELPARHVDADDARRVRAESPLPRHHLPARFVEHEASDLPDHPGVFGDGNEFGRAEQSSRRMAPPHQRLEAADASRFAAR